jgi:DNA-binding response OmpR family regulator
MARILSISYDETLLRTRQLLLETAGHEVSSAFGYKEALDSSATAVYDVAIIGHSIPKKDKLGIIQTYRGGNPDGIVIALTRAGEVRLREVDHYINPGDPEELLRALAWILNPAAERRSELRRVK